MYNERNEQLELVFDRNPVTRPVQRRRRRMPQAGWWFDQIRKMIDAGEDHPVRRPVQARFQFRPSGSCRIRLKTPEIGRLRFARRMPLA